MILVSLKDILSDGKALKLTWEYAANSDLFYRFHIQDHQVYFLGSKSFIVFKGERFQFEQERKIYRGKK